MKPTVHPSYLRLLPDNPTQASFDYPARLEIQNRRLMEMREQFRRDMRRIFERHEAHIEPRRGGDAA